MPPCASRPRETTCTKSQAPHETASPKPLPDEDEQERRGTNTWPSRIFASLSLGLITAFAVWTLSSLWVDLGHLSLANAARHWIVLAVALGLSLLNYGLRVIRWRLYLYRLGHALPWAFCATTYVAGFAFTLSPGKLGEMLRSGYYRTVGVPFTKVASAFFVERLLDLAVMLLLAAPLLMFFPHYRIAAGTLGLLIFSAVVLLFVIPWEPVVHRLASTKRLPSLVKNFNTGALKTLTDARPLLSGRALIYGPALGFCAWGLEAIALWFLGWLFPSGHLEVSVAMGIYALSILVGASSFVPGGLGGTEATMAILLNKQGYSAVEALLIALACRFTTLWFAIVLGWLAVFVLRRQARRKAPSS